ncbi:Severe Depolymerization of Actin [Serendipita sp. 399]|nr:Severe Depolymerization of Actin [Serendipita sp. 399]
MGKQHTNRGALLASNLPQLQNLIKRDPQAYRDEFMQQWNHFQSILRIWKLQPDSIEEGQHLRELVSFMAQVAQCYPQETQEFPNELATLLRESYSNLPPELRRSFVQNLVTLRNKEIVTSIDLLRNLFPLLPRTTSSSLRSFIRTIILTDIKTANARTKNHKLNRAVQTMLFTMVEKGMDAEVQGDKGKPRVTTNADSGQESKKETEALWAIVVTRELWKKNVWNDAKSVSIVALGCFHPVAKVQSASLHFFLGSDEEDDDSESEDEGPDIKALQHRREVNKKTKSSDRRLARAEQTIKKKNNSKNSKSTPNFPAIQLLNDPQGFGEKLYDGLVRYDKRFSLEHKLLVMQLLSRIMGTHKLCILGFYTYIMKYLTHHQLRVPLILASLAQSVHELTPPDVLTPVVRKIAQEFVHPGVGAEVIAAGINAIREVCKRQPWCLGEADGGPELLSDLIEYRKSRDKGVVVAARSLLQLYREVNPGLLKRRERGKTASMGISGGSQPLPFGQQRGATMDIDGLNLLEQHLKQARGSGSDLDMSEGDEEKAWENWDVASESSSDESEDGWINVESDGQEEFMVSDSDDEKGTVAPETTGGGTAAAKERVHLASTLATTKILTPADFALLQDLRLKEAQRAVQSGGGSQSKQRLALLEAQKRATAVVGEDPSAALITESSILGVRKKAKADYEERLASIAKGREGREKFGSAKGKKNKASVSSSTNKEKRRNKPIMMARQSSAVRAKKMASLKDKQKRLRAHIDRAKKAYH